jgi:uncharacterized membrane protein YdcZ (DUF606 family)
MADINPAGTPATAQTSDKPFGPVAAAFLASAVGAVVLGILTTLAEANEDINSFLEFNARVGPLAGKTLIAVGAFLVAWVVLHLALRGKDPRPRGVFVATAILFAIAVVLTFPTFFQAFAPAE